MSNPLCAAASANEDVGSFGTEWHVALVFWFIGGVDPKAYSDAEPERRLSEIPISHNLKFAPVIHPTLDAGVQTLLEGACS